MSDKIGPTGEFPEGKLNENDEGEILVAVGTEDGNVVITFGKRIKWVGLPPKEAVALAEAIIERARMIARKNGEVLTVKL